MSKLLLLVVFSFACASYYVTLKVTDMGISLTTEKYYENSNKFDYLGGGTDYSPLQHYYDVKPKVEQ